MKVLMTVSVSPWSSALSTTALRLAHAIVTEGASLDAVFFHGDGVYHALSSEASDAGLSSPQDAWLQFHQDHGVELLLCPAAAARRLPVSRLGSDIDSFRQAGLAHLLEAMTQSDRVVHF